MIVEPVAALVIGAGPAGLMAASELADAGYRVVVIESKPTPARKFLMAGKSGLNLTKNEALETFVARYAEAADWLAPMIGEFGPEQVFAWAESLGEPLFTGSSGRVFPRTMKASPLLRRWLASLAGRGVMLRTGWQWVGFEEAGLLFRTPDGSRILTSPRVVLALGGASWAKLGSDGAWVPLLMARGVEVAPFRPANMGFEIAWSEKMEAFFGEPLKSIAMLAGGQRVRGEATISARGLEGGGLYPLARYLRDGAALEIDLFPDLPDSVIEARLAARPASESLSNRLRKALRLEGVRLAIVHEFARPLPADPRDLASLLKSLPIRLGPPRPIDEAISVAGGVRRESVTKGLMLKALPSIFVAGEMLDWEAPTGGYLLTACLATGRWAGRAAALWPPTVTAECDSTDDQASVHVIATRDH